jgi:hypothetical protein
MSNEALVNELNVMANNPFQPPHVRELLRKASEALAQSGQPHARDAIAWTPETGYVFAEQPAEAVPSVGS